MDRRQTFERVLRLEPGKTALLVIDMQRAFLAPGEVMEVPAAREIIPRIQTLLTLFREKRLPVVFTEFLARVVSAKQVADEIALWDGASGRSADKDEIREAAGRRECDAQTGI